MTEQVEQWICIKFCIELEYSSMEAIQIVQKSFGDDSMSAEMQNNKNGFHYGQLVIGSFITTMHLLMHHTLCRVFWRNIKSPRWLSPPTAQIWCLRLPAFPKTKITFERKEISDCQWDPGKYVGEADGNWENYMRSPGACFEGKWSTIVLCTVFLGFFTFFNKCLYFSYYTAGYFLDRPLYTMFTIVLWMFYMWLP